MRPLIQRLGVRAPKATLLAAALLGAGAIASPPVATAQPASVQRFRAETAIKRETVEQRISSLHAALKITPSEETNWGAVAQAMRDNEAARQKLVAARKSQAPHAINAVDDLRAYEMFTQAHVNGLKALISSFETLYRAMPDTQKAVADQVFRKFGERRS